MSQFPLPNFSIDLTGRVALVTGASAGLGERFAQVLAAAGARVAIAARRLDRLEALAAKIRAAGGEALPVAMDAEDAGSLAAAVQAAEDAFGTVDVLVNNAGIPDAQRAHKISVDLYDRVTGINLRAPWLLSCDVARRLIAAGKPGRIVNISSMAAFQYEGNGAALYTVTKAAVVRMTEALAVEWAPYDINVNAIAPGGLPLGNDGRDDFARRRHGVPFRAAAIWRSRATRLHAPLPRFTVVRFRHRRDNPGR